MNNYETDQFFGKELKVYTNNDPSSGSSGCSGADARQADNRNEELPKFSDLLGLFANDPIDVGAGWDSSCSAVSARSGDGQVWEDFAMMYLIARCKEIMRGAKWWHPSLTRKQIQVEALLDIAEELRELAKAKSNTD